MHEGYMELKEIMDLVTKEYSNWEIDPKPLGNGSFGVVFQMVDRENGEKRALKVIPIPHDDSEIDRRMLRGYAVSEIEKYYTGVKSQVLDEVLNIIQLRANENVVNIFGYREIRRKDNIGWVVCFDMEYLPPLVETKHLSEQQIVRMALDMCNALRSCHSRKIVHRDIKPDNILQKGDSYVLADFGVSKIAKSQSSLSLRGTYDYMAPELVRQESFPDVSPDTVDIYSLGITLYVYANQNRLPFIESANDMMYAEKRDEMSMKRWNSDAIPGPCGVSERLSKIILCACEKDPRWRYQSAAEMEYDLLHLNTNDFLYCDRMKQLAEASSKSVVETPRLQDVQLHRTVPAQRLDQAPAQSTPILQKPDDGKTDSKEPVKRKRKLIFGIVAGILVLITAGVWIYFAVPKAPGTATSVDAACEDLDESLYGPTVEHYYDSLLGRKPSSQEKEKAFSDIRFVHGDTECVIRDLLKSKEFTGKKLTDKDYIRTVYQTIDWGTASDKEIQDGEAIIREKSREAYADYLFEKSWPTDHAIVRISREGIIGKNGYFIENKANPTMQYLLTTYIYDAKTGTPMEFNGNEYLGKTAITANQTGDGPDVPNLPKGKYRLVITKEPYGTVVYDEGFEVK